eukprot:gene36134-44567_t
MAASEQTNQRLLRLCLDLQGFNFCVTHVSGVRHLGADAVSRLLRHGEMPYVRDADDLREDFGPLTEDEKSKLQQEYSADAWYLISTINEHREQERLKLLEREAEQQELLQEQLAIEGSLSKPEVESLPSETQMEFEVDVEPLVCMHCTPAEVNDGVMDVESTTPIYTMLCDSFLCEEKPEPGKVTCFLCSEKEHNNRHRSGNARRAQKWRERKERTGKLSGQARLDDEVLDIIGTQDQRVQEQEKWWASRRKDLENQFHAQEQLIGETETSKISVAEVAKYIDIMRSMETNDLEDKRWNRLSMDER